MVRLNRDDDDADFTERATAFTKLLKPLHREELSEEDLVALAGLLQELQEMLSDDWRRWRVK